MAEQFEQYFKPFMDKVHVRMEAGAKSYGDVSFQKSVTDLLTDIQQELEDVCGWSGVLWGKIEMLKDAIRKELDTAWKDHGPKLTVDMNTIVPSDVMITSELMDKVKSDMSELSPQAAHILKGNWPVTGEPDTNKEAFQELLSRHFIEIHEFPIDASTHEKDEYVVGKNWSLTESGTNARDDLLKSYRAEPTNDLN